MVPADRCGSMAWDVVTPITSKLCSRVQAAKSPRVGALQKAGWSCEAPQRNTRRKDEYDLEDSVPSGSGSPMSAGLVQITSVGKHWPSIYKVHPWRIQTMAHHPDTAARQ